MIRTISAIVIATVACCIISGVSTRPAEDLNPPNTTSYLPFYGGAKGQYLQVTKDKTGAIIKETIILEEKIKDLIKPDREKPLLTAPVNNKKNIFEQNLKQVHESAQKILALQQIAKKKGSLTPLEIEELNSELQFLGASAENLSSLSGKGTKNWSAVFGSTTTDSKNKEDEKFEENVGEEDVAIESEESTPEVGNTSQAEAKPVGLAIAGEGGVASSRPVATAVVAAGGLAVARPVATAIAGVDPAALGVGIVYGKI